ncbi:hypothetical protein [Emticicia sp. C21]|uniref:hypothetical protein n=1 Tax=Emticicia sp. C21 TaxID=2302915 RepID=UPI000E357785|nr:hypothetical protein [Emticicia sp. C21]RFS17004.1 hypothetical protein D0T08_10020 [Emticicia sp. C21]
MKDATNYILSEFFRVLNGAISHEGALVKVFALEQDEADTDNLFIRLYAAHTTEFNTKTNFGSKVSINLDIVNRLTGGERTEHRVNEVASGIGQLILPTPSSTGLANSTEFQLVNVRSGGPSVNLSDRSNTDLIVRKIITFEVTVNQL